MKIDLYNQKAKKVGDVEVTDSIFGVTVNPKVLSQYLFSYLSNQRQSNASTKDRSEVRGGGKKPWKQKGTGRARAGSNRSPLWKGGGVTFGPTSNVNWKKHMTKSFTAAALRNTFSSLVQNEKLKVVDGFDISGDKLTKAAVEVKENFEAKKLTVVTATKKDNVIKSFANVTGAKVVLITDLNAHDLLNGGTVLLEQDCLNFINEKWNK